MSDEGDGGAGGNVEVDPVQHLVAAAVGEANALEPDVAGEVAEVARATLVDDLRLLVEQVVDLVQRGRRGEERPVELRELLHRVEEVLDVEHEGEERSDLDGALEVEVAAVAEHDRERDGREQVDEREVPAAQDDRLLVRLAVALADLAEVADVDLLAGEGLDDAHAGDVLGEGRGHEPEALPHRPVGARRVAAEQHRADAHHRDHREGREGESPVEDEQQDRRADQRQRALDERRDAVRDELVERLDVVRQPADDHPGAVPLVEAEGQPLEMLEEGRAQVGQHALADPARQVRLRVGHAPVREAGEEEERDDQVELAPGSPFTASSSASLARNGGASAIAVARRSVSTDRIARPRYGATSRPSVEKRRRVFFQDQSATRTPRSSSRWLPAW